MRSLLGIFILWLLTACKKNPEPAIPISGFVVTDNYGNIIANIGSVEDDWKTGSFTGLPKKEQELLNDHDSLPSLNTVVSNVTVVPAYPNPASHQFRFTCSSNDSVVLRLLVVNETGKIFFKQSFNMKGAASAAFDVSDRTKFPSGKSLRCIYAFSAAGNQNFKTGHGDVKVCDNSNYSNCF